MRPRFAKIMWVLSCLTTATVIFYIIRSFITGYDENITAALYAFAISCVTVILLYIFRLFDDESYSRQKKLRLFVNWLGTPLVAVEALLIGAILGLLEKLYLLLIH
jgi:high-affinity Fe2+/Pb2+ permease